jgi:hypothetical protein
MSTDASTPTPEEAYEWEQLCLARLRERVEAYRGSQHRPEISGVYLEGDYPHTRICAGFWHLRLSEWRRECFSLWSPALKATGPEVGTSVGDRTPPGQVAMLIHTEIGEIN